MTPDVFGLHAARFGETSPGLTTRYKTLPTTQCGRAVAAVYDRRHFLTKVLAAGTAAVVSPIVVARAAAEEPKTSNGKGVVVSTSKLSAPSKGGIGVAVVVSEGATVIDFAGPWDVFGSVMIPERGSDMTDQMPFQLFMVSEKTEPIKVENGMKVIPDYTFANVPPCQVVVVPAQQGSKALESWLRKIAPLADVTMSVCVGATLLASAGLLDGKSATTHSDHYEHFAKEFPQVDWKRGVRFVENEKISTSGGETCGIDLALRVVERYFGRAVAVRTAVFIEHQGKGWMV
jgi:transcriptional regulator GlxA family with amidase domain